MTAGPILRAQPRAERMSHRGPRAADSAARRADARRRAARGRCGCRPAGGGRNGSTQKGPAAIPMRAEPPENEEANRSRSSTTSLWLEGWSSPSPLRRSPRRSRRRRPKPGRWARPGSGSGNGGGSASAAPGSRSRQPRPGSRFGSVAAGVTLAAATAGVAAPNAVVVAAAAVVFAVTARACADSVGDVADDLDGFALACLGCLGRDSLRLLRRPLSACRTTCATATGLGLVVVDGQVGEQRVEPALRQPREPHHRHVTQGRPSRDHAGWRSTRPWEEQ